jgi:NAD dependent epimerase/dehydratase family enzyme
VLGRPAFLPVPAPVIRAFGGQMGNELLLEGQRAVPARALASGFAFELGDLEDCLCHELGR